jgi:hypothetical protein
VIFFNANAYEKVIFLTAFITIFGLISNFFLKKTLAIAFKNIANRFRMKNIFNPLKSMETNKIRK